MNLQLLHPALLWGLAAVALPVLIHFLSRRRAQPIRFAAVEFLLRSTRRTARRLHLRQLLLLLIRMLILGALATALMGPQLLRRQQRTTQQPRHIIWCLDASTSMQALHEGRSLFELAQQRINRSLDSLDATVPTGLLLAGDDIVALHDPPTLDRYALRRALNDAVVSSGSSSLGACVLRAQSSVPKNRAPDSNSPGSTRVIVVSDGAAHAWHGKDISDLQGEFEIELERVPDKNLGMIDNVALQHISAHPSGSTTPGRYDIEIGVQRYAAGESNATRDVTLTLEVDAVPVATVTAQLDAYAGTRKKFMQVPIQRPAGSELTLSVKANADALAFDDQVLLPLELPSPVAVLVVDGDPQAVRHRDEVFYLERALALDSGGGATLVPRVVNLESLRVGDLDHADVVLLANVVGLDAEIAQALIERVRAGAGLFVSVGDRVDVDFYNNVLGELLVAPMRGEKSFVPLDDPQQRNALSLEIVDAEHPLLRSIGEQKTLGLGQTHAHTIMLTNPQGANASTEVLRFSNGAPALAEKRFGAGQVLMLLTSIDRDWSDLAIRPGFVPLLRQSMRYLANALQNPRPRRVEVGSAIELLMPRDSTALEVTDPKGIKQRIGTAGQNKVTFGPVTEMGMHQVAALIDTNSSRLLPEQRFASYTPLPESDTRLLDITALQAQLTQGTTLKLGQTSAKNDINLWPYVLLLLVLLVVVEATLVRRG